MWCPEDASIWPSKKLEQKAIASGSSVPIRGKSYKRKLQLMILKPLNWSSPSPFAIHHLKRHTSSPSSSSSPTSCHINFNTLNIFRLPDSQPISLSSAILCDANNASFKTSHLVDLKVKPIGQRQSPTVASSWWLFFSQPIWKKTCTTVKLDPHKSG